jgi:hypothetical protein
MCWHIAGLVLSSAHNESLKECVLVICSDDFKSEIPATGGAWLQDLVAHCGHPSAAYIMQPPPMVRVRTLDMLVLAWAKGPRLQVGACQVGLEMAQWGSPPKVWPLSA